MGKLYLVCGSTQECLMAWECESVDAQRESGWCKNMTKTYCWSYYPIQWPRIQSIVWSRWYRCWRHRWRGHHQGYELSVDQWGNDPKNITRWSEYWWIYLCGLTVSLYRNPKKNLGIFSCLQFQKFLYNVPVELYPFCAHHGQRALTSAVYFSTLFLLWVSSVCS